MIPFILDSIEPTIQLVSKKQGLRCRLNCLVASSSFPGSAQLSVAISKHIYLFAAAALFLLFLVLPYSLVLVFVQSLHAKKILSWVDKLKPLIDAYTGPYQDKYHFWTGFLLLVRNILYLAFAFKPLPHCGTSAC